MKIGELDLSWFYMIALKNVIIEDQNGETALEAGNITVGFKPISALKNKWILTSVRLFGVTCHIKKETQQSDSNIQFIIDALSSPDNNSDNSMELQIQSILIRRGSFTYDIVDKDNATQQFNPNHININNVSGKLAIKHFSKDSINAQISKLSFNEISGLNVNKFSFNITGNKDSVSLENMALTLPRSLVSIPNAGLKMTNAENADKFELVVSLAPSRIAPKDLSFIAPILKDFSDVVEISADIKGPINSISLSKLALTYGREMSFNGNLDLNNLINKEEEMYLFGQVQRMNLTTEGLRKIKNNFKDINIILPEPVMNIGVFNFTGEISGFTDNLVAFGNLSSPIGSVHMDMLIGRNNKQDTSMHLKGNIASSDLLISSLFEEGNPFGKVRFNAEIDFSQNTKKNFSGTINAQINEIEYKDYNYENIYLSGKFKENEYEGIININDPNGRLEMQGLIRNEGKKSVFDFKADIANLHPDKLNITNEFVNPDISLKLNANFTGSNPDEFNGYIEIDNLAFNTAQDSFEIKDFRIETLVDELLNKHITISSDLINGEINGVYSFSSLVPDICETIGLYLPTLMKSLDYKEGNDNNDFNFNLAINNTEKISKTLKLPVTIIEKTDISGHYNSITNSFSTEIDAPLINIGKMSLLKGHFLFDNANEQINMQLSASIAGKNNTFNLISLTSNAKEDNLNTLLSWAIDTDNKYGAEINMSTAFAEDIDDKGKKTLRTEITIPRSQILLKDSLWHLEPASVIITEKNVNVDNFYITKGNQYLKINGIVSDNPNDILVLDLKDIEISYIFDILNKPSIHFGGQATGTMRARDLTGSMMLDGRLEVQDFSFHNAVQGRLSLSSEWDNDEQGILLMGSIYKNDSTWTDVNGYIFPIGKEQGLSLFFNANEINIAFLNTYMKAFSKNVSGQGSGNVRLYGTFSNVFLDGKAYVKDGNITINTLNTSYSFSDTVLLEEHFIKTQNTTVYDKDGNAGNLNFTLQHNCFEDMKYDLDINIDKMLVYDIPERINPEMYGKVYVSGTAVVSGTEDNILIEGSVRSDEGTSVGFNFSENSTVKDYDFITFVQEKEDSTLIINENHKKNDMGYQFNFNVNVTPDAQIELMMDPTSGDKIRGNGNGNIQVQYGNQSDIQMFGNYLISEGIYNFSLQQVISKRFNIRDGSTVLFRGDPMSAILDINAIYNVTANIQDLDETLIQETASPSIMVNCVLQIDGRLQNPTVTFNLELPNSNSELERQIRSFIDTEDMMTRQIIYLLFLNKFYTPDYSRNDYRANEFSVVASSALSAQLSNILNSFTDKVQIGTNIRSRQDGVKDTEVEMLLSSQLLNNRLLFNGNFGYKDNYIQSNAFVGEFDLEYKLTPGGDISLKAYNHANDLYRYSKSLTRQGVGVMFRKDFDKISNLFRRKKNATKTSIPASTDQE